MATYRQIIDYVRCQNNFAPKTCWVAHVLSDHGLTKYRAPNRKGEVYRVNPCPDSKRGAIEGALRYFKMI